MIVVTTPTGHIGSHVVKDLLTAGEQVRVVARDPDKLAPDVRAKVEVTQGSSDDEAVLGRALAGASALFHCVPAVFDVLDVHEHYLRFTRPAIVAMKQRGVSRVVSVSGIGRHSKLNAGVVGSALAKDVELERGGFDVRALWCPGFMDNAMNYLPTIRSMGSFFGVWRGDRKAPQVAARDIGAVAARLLRDRSWSGPGGVAVLGPEDLSTDDMAAIISDVLARPVRYQQVSPDAYKAQLKQHGASDAMAQGLVDMFAAKDEGLDDSEPRTPDNTTPTTFRQWCIEVLRPTYVGQS